MFSYWRGARKVRGIEFSHRQEEDSFYWADLKGQGKKKNTEVKLYESAVHSLSPRPPQPSAYPNLAELPTAAYSYCQGQVPLKARLGEQKVIQAKTQTATKWKTTLLRISDSFIKLIPFLPNIPLFVY